MVVTQHSGDGKANQYFLRGFNLDHGTDFATSVNGVPVNMPTHAHGQGYTDLNFLIPELVDHIDFRKGPYSVADGDFAAAGSANIFYKDRLDRPFVRLELGAHNFRRSVLAVSGESGTGLRWLGVTDKIAIWGLHSRLALFSNFTYFTKGDEGDQFLQCEGRHALGLSGSRAWSHQLAGADAQTSVGLQLRNDRVRVGLLDSVARELTGTVRDDTVHLMQWGVFGENMTQWTPWLRTVVGLRANTLHARVRSHTLAENSGSASDFLLSPKSSVVLGPWANTEFFFNAGRGFHSNGARGTTIRVDPANPTQAVERVPPLVPAVGYEVGLRGQWWPGLVTSVALWRLHSHSELVYLGDEGSTEAGPASRRHGIEWNTRWAPARWLLINADLAWTHARQADGSRIENAVDQVSVVSATVRPAPGWSATLAWRRIGSAALTADNSVRSRPSLTTNLHLAWAPPGERWSLSLDIFNLLNRRNDDIQYWYASRLPGEAGDVEGMHVHPAEKRTIRATLRLAF